jgi:putative sigma-54 modulation protein
VREPKSQTITKEEDPMNLHLTGQHLTITPAIRDYVVGKLGRVRRHFDHVIDVAVVMTVEKLAHKVEANLHASGKDIHVEAVEPDMYAAIDLLADRLDRQVVKHKEKLALRRYDGEEIKREPPAAEPYAAAGALAPGGARNP